MGWGHARHLQGVQQHARGSHIGLSRCVDSVPGSFRNAEWWSWTKNYINKESTRHKPFGEGDTFIEGHTATTQGEDRLKKRASNNDNDYAPEPK